MTVVGLSELLRFKRAYMVDFKSSVGAYCMGGHLEREQKAAIGWGGASCPGKKLRKREQIADKFAF